jgi:pyruvate,water dikinase
MIRTASQMRTTDLALLSDQELAAEIERRQAINTKWANIYWSDFIPFAHGIRLFGQVYNDVVRPDNPYEFTDLLGQTQMESLARNRMLEALADMVRNDPPLRKKLENKDYLLSGDDFTRKVNHFIEHYGDLSCPVTGATQCGQGPDALIKIVLEMAAHPPMGITDISSRKINALREKFFGCFENGERAWAEELLDLARASYRLRDDDNIHLGRIEAQAMAAVQEGQRRLHAGTPIARDPAGDKVLREALAKAPSQEKLSKGALKPRPTEFTLKARQLIGQPAGPGLSKGRARVITSDADLTDFKHGEILVCDAVDPNMTFVVPLAAGIVERRGGMLIHGAIIAREYGLPCVTGVTEATRLIKTGDAMTVDGYLGIVTIGG